MGFYAPAQIVRDAERHGVAVRAPDVNFSDWDSSLGGGRHNLRHEFRMRRSASPDDATILDRLHPTHADMRDDIRSTHAVRLGFRQIKGFREDDANALVAARGRGYDSVRDLWLRSGLSRPAIERLADADAFRSLGLDRRDALWAARELGGGKASERLPLFDMADLADIRKEPDVRPAADADRRARRQRLPLPQPVPEGASAVVPPRASRRENILPNSALRDLPATSARVAQPTGTGLATPASPSPASSSSASARARRAASSS